MEVNFNLLISLITNRNYFTENDFSALIKADDYLFSLYGKKYYKEKKVLFNTLTTEAAIICREYLLEQYPVLTELYNLLEGNNNYQQCIQLIETYKKALPEKYILQPIPEDFSIEKTLQKRKEK